MNRTPRLLLHPAARISLLYLVMGILWILLSDKFLEVTVGEAISTLAVRAAKIEPDGRRLTS